MGTRMSRLPLLWVQAEQDKHQKRTRYCTDVNGSSRVWAGSIQLMFFLAPNSDPTPPLHIILFVRYYMYDIDKISF